MEGDERFQLRGCRELLKTYSDSIQISSQIRVIETSIPDDPGLAFTHCRGLLETVCKTILADRGIATEETAKSSWLMSQTLRVLKLTPDSFDGDKRVESGAADIVRGLNMLINGVVSLRNSQGIGPHGKDAIEQILDAEYAVVMAHAVDSAASLLYRLHRKQADNDPLQRMRYGDHSDFDEYLDELYSDFVIEETPIQASKALFLLDIEAYRQRLVVFLDNPGFSEGEELVGETDG